MSKQIISKESTDAFLDRLMPADTPAYMAPAWLGCIRFALGNPDMLVAFMTDTGNQWVPGGTPIERMIDEATGADRAFIEAFILWANVNVWGPIHHEDDDA